MNFAFCRGAPSLEARLEQWTSLRHAAFKSCASWFACLVVLWWRTASCKQVCLGNGCSEFLKLHLAFLIDPLYLIRCGTMFAISLPLYRQIHLLTFGSDCIYTLIILDLLVFAVSNVCTCINLRRPLPHLRFNLVGRQSENPTNVFLYVLIWIIDVSELQTGPSYSV